MSNLGGYQILTTFTKAIGGPKKLIALVGLAVAGAAAAAGIGGYSLGKKSNKKDKKNIEIDSNVVYEVVSDCKNENGLELHIGDKFKVLQSDGESIMIEKIGDNNNPYFVSRVFLYTNTNFN